MMSRSFIRPRGDKAWIVHWNSEDGAPPPALYADLRVGDLIHDGEGYRSIESYVVTAGGAIAPIGQDGNGDGAIRVEVTRHLEDPVEFYESELEGAVCAIELDPELHAPALAGVELEEDGSLPAGEAWWVLGAYSVGVSPPVAGSAHRGGERP